MITSPDALNGSAPSEPAKAQAPAGPFTPPALDGAFDALVQAGLTMAQLREVEAIFDRALGEIFSHATKYHPADLGVLLKWLYHLRIESTEPASSLMSNATQGETEHAA